jgi:hypothetical protein
LTITSASGTVLAHNERPAAVWGTPGKHYDSISRGIADSIEHCVLRLDPRPYGASSMNAWSRVIAASHWSEI